MHKIPWQYGSTFGEICQKYVDSVKLHGSESVIVVFDGYVSGRIQRIRLPENRRSVGPDR